MALIARLLRGASSARQLRTAASGAPSRWIATVAPALSSALKPFQLKKITQEFDHVYDSNHDGILDRNEVENFKKRLGSFTASRQAGRFHEAYSGLIDEYWSVVCSLCRHDQNGGISRDSWINMWEGIILRAGPEMFLKDLPEVLHLIPRALFPAMDSHGDGAVDPQEYSDYWHHIGGYPKPSPERLDDIFADLTEDGRYRLDIQRVVELYADFYISSDVNTAGKYICGPIDYTEFICK